VRSTLVEPTTRAPRTVPGVVAALLVAVVVLGVGLRLWRVDDRTFTPDESYTAFAVDRPLPDVVRYIADTDPHPPLYYLTAAPFQRLTDDEWALRLPSALCSVAALVVFAWWQRTRGWEGLVATALFAVAPFQLLFAAQARMYGLMILTGVLAAWAADRWSGGGGRRWLALAMAAAFVAAFSQASGLLLAGGLVLVPGLRRDRAAWRWRGAALGVVAVFGVVWGAAALHAAGDSLYRAPTLDQVTVTINEVLAPVPGQRWLVLAMLVLGGIALVRFRPVTGRVWLALAVAPVAAALVVSFRSPIFIPKTLAVVSWGVPVALAALAAAAARIRPVAGATVCALLLLVVAPYVQESLQTSEETEGIVRATQLAAQPGDAVAAHPPGTLVPWYLDRSAASSRPIAVPWSDTDAWVPGGAPFTGRVWLVDTLYSAAALDVDAPSCGPDQVIDTVYRLRCVILPTEAGN
jgi:MFS family permease